jgi:hypothetical protein
MAEDKITVKEVFYYEDRTMKGGIFIYKVENDSDKFLFNDFYVVTFDDKSSEIVWGVGDDPKSALECAEREWDVANMYEGNEYFNPFSYILTKIDKGEILLPKL